MRALPQHALSFVKFLGELFGCDAKTTFVMSAMRYKLRRGPKIIAFTANVDARYLKRVESQGPLFPKFTQSIAQVDALACIDLEDNIKPPPTGFYLAAAWIVRHAGDHLCQQVLRTDI
jgi:hypothetical protein